MTEHKEMLTILERQRAASLAEGQVSAEVRIDRIDRAINLLQTHGKHLREAMSEDFGHRSMHQSKLTDIGASISPLKHAKKNIRSGCVLRNVPLFLLVCWVAEVRFNTNRWA